MTTVRRLKVVSGFMLLAAIATCSHVWGDGANDKTKKGFLDNAAPAPARVEKNLAEDLAVTKFTNRSLVTYQTQAGELLIALQVQPKLAAALAQPQDVAILVDTGASMARTPLKTAREIAEKLVAAAGPTDRITLWTLNTPAATTSLTRGLEPAGSQKVKDALKSLSQEVPFGANDLKNAVENVVSKFDNREGRQRVIVLLGSGKSLLNPISNADRQKLCDTMTAKGIAFFSVPLGANLDSANLHGLPTGTGGLLVRPSADEPVAKTVENLTKAIAAPILYTKKLQLPGVDAYPSKLPPVRGDSPTLVVGTMKPGKTLTYTIEGTIAGKDVRIPVTLDVPAAEIDNFFLVNMVEQWKVADRKESPSPFRADRALAMSQVRAVLTRDDLKEQGAAAIMLDNPDVAAQMFAFAKKIDPNDPEVDAGVKIVDKMRNKLLTKEQLQGALGKPGDQAIRFERGNGKGAGKITRDQLGKMVALADGDEKMDGPAAPKLPGPDAGFPPDREPLLRIQQQRQAVEEQRIGKIVNEAEGASRRILPNDPEAAHDMLKRTLASIRDNTDLSPQTRQALINRLENSLRAVDTQAIRIKRDLDERMRNEAQARERIATTEARERTEEQIVRRIQSLNVLFATGRFEEMYREQLALQADTIARGNPIQSVMVAENNMGINAIHKKEQDEVRRASEERYLLTMLQVDKSHIPFPDEPPVGFPPAAIWRELTNRRKGLYESVGLGEDPAGRVNALKIKDKLSQPVNLDKGIDPNTPLKDALEFLADRYDLTLIVDSKAFEAIGVQKVEEQPVQLPKMIGVSMATVLRLLLAQIKGDVYTGTYLIRRDYIEVTTTYNAAAEKVVRAYPVADLVIPIPNAVNTQALQQTLGVNQQFNQNQNPFAQGGFGGFAGLLGGMGGNPFAQGGAGGGALGNGFNPFQLQGGGVGNNQFGNLGGQFGFQGRDSSRQLMELIVKVVAPGEWFPLGRDPNTANNPGLGGAPPGLGGPDPLAMDAIVPQELLNSLDYYAPARALVVRGSSRLHTRLEGGLLGPGPKGGPPAAAQGALGIQRDGALVIGPRKDVPKDGKDKGNTAVAKGPAPAKPLAPPTEMDVKKVWEDALAKMVADPKADHTGLVIACADFLVEHKKFNHAAEFLKAELRLGIVTRPWVYEALGIALQLSGGSPDEIERAQVSAVDMEPLDGKGFLRAAAAMAELKNHKQAVAFCRQAALMEPNSADAYANALVYAQESKDPQAMAWAASSLLKQDWPADNDELQGKARAKLGNLAKVLQQEARQPEAERMLASVQQVKERDLVITLSWQGDADFDLRVREPSGTQCSYLNRQTPGGGTLLGEDLANLAKAKEGVKKHYVAAEAFSGDYDITVDRVWGQPVVSKVTVTVIRHQGTAKERVEFHPMVLDRTKSLKIALADGRRNSLASVPPPASAQQSERVDKPASPDRVLNKLRAMTDPALSEISGMRGGVASSGVAARQNSRTDVRSSPSVPADPKLTTYQKVNSFMNNAIDMTARTTPVMGDNGQVQELRVKLNPVFQTTGRGPAMPTNPLIPGGF